MDIKFEYHQVARLNLPIEDLSILDRLIDTNHPAKLIRKEQAPGLTNAFL